MEGRVIAGPELEMVGTLATDGFGMSREPRRHRLALGSTGADDLDDYDGDEVDGMEIS